MKTATNKSQETENTQSPEAEENKSQKQKTLNYNKPRKNPR